MGPRTVKVRSYAGSRAEERPISLELDGETIGVSSVIGRSVEEDSRTGMRLRVFRIEGSDGHRYTLVHDEQADEWSLRSH